MALMCVACVQEQERGERWAAACLNTVGIVVEFTNTVAPI